MAEYILFFSIAYKTYTKIDHMLSYIRQKLVFVF